MCFRYLLIVAAASMLFASLAGAGPPGVWVLPFAPVVAVGWVAPLVVPGPQAASSMLNPSNMTSRERRATPHGWPDRRAIMTVPSFPARAFCTVVPWCVTDEAAICL